MEVQEPTRSVEARCRPMTMTQCRRLFREIDRCRKDDGSIDVRDWPLIWENSGVSNNAMHNIHFVDCFNNSNVTLLLLLSFVA